MLWEPFVGKGRSFQRSGRKRLHGTAASQRSKKREFFSFRSLNAPGVSLQPFLNALGPRTTSGARPTAASRRNSLPPKAQRASCKFCSQYSVSGANGRLRYSGVGKGLRPPAVADRCFRVASTSVSLEGFPRWIFREGVCLPSGKGLSARGSQSFSPVGKVRVGNKQVFVVLIAPRLHIRYASGKEPRAAFGGRLRKGMGCRGPAERD